jgi:voltage-dependent potassium channel beta subunit
MEYRRLGKWGVQVSALSFGSWVTFSTQLDENDAYQCMKVAYDAGINFFDNAEGYAHGQSEVIMGKVLKRAGWSRDSYLVSSKVFFGSKPEKKPNQTGLSRKHVIEACNQALQRLQVEYLDFYFCHRPDPNTPIEETVFAMDTLVRQGKVLYWGTSEWSSQEIMEAYGLARQYHMSPPTMEQPQYNMLVRERFEREYARLYSSIGLGTTIWSPLASGVLTGKYNEGIPAGSRLSLPGYEWLRDRFFSEQGKKNIEKVKRLLPLAKELGTTLNKLAIAWCLKNPHVSTVILGASRIEQLQDNLKALDVVPLLTEEVMEKIEGILQNKPALT